MNIEVYTICYNEEFMLPFFLKHYANIDGVSKIVIYDNYSTDNTIKIAKAFTKCQVEIIYYDSNNQLNDEIYLNIKNDCWKKSQADWVIVCDVDELLYITNSESLLQIEPIIFKTVGYQMISENLPSHNDLITNQIQYGVQDDFYSKCVMFKPNINEINFTPGCHKCFPSHEIINSGFLLLHYKYISLDYVVDNYRLRLQRLSKVNIDKNYATHYLMTTDDIKKEFNTLNTKKIKII
jgi:glycosyltransferase involved in cell wall biosynthesis